MSVSNDTIVALRAAGMSVRAIARRLKAPTSTVRCRAYKLVSMGLIATTCTPNENVYTPAETATIAELYGKGVKYDDIAARIGRPRQGVEKRIRELRSRGVIDGYRHNPPKKRLNAFADDDQRDDFSITVYQAVVANPGKTSAEIGTLTGYGTWACERELLRLSRFDEPLVNRVHGKGWFASLNNRKYVDAVTVGG